MSRRRKPQTRRPGPAATATDAVKTHVIKILQACAVEGEAKDAKIAEVEASGKLIVESHVDYKNQSWSITDRRTGEQLANGTDALDEEQVEETLARLDPDDRWVNIASIGHGDYAIDVSPTESVPPGLAEALEEWASDPRRAEEVAVFLGWPASKVLRCVETDEGEVWP